MIAKLVTLYNKTLNPDQKFWAVEHLSDLMFQLGFRIVNPEYRTNSTIVEQNTEDLKELIKKLDDQSDLQPSKSFNKRAWLHPKMDNNRRGI